MIIAPTSDNENSSLTLIDSDVLVIVRLVSVTAYHQFCDNMLNATCLKRKSTSLQNQNSMYTSALLYRFYSAVLHSVWYCHNKSSIHPSVCDVEASWSHRLIQCGWLPVLVSLGCSLSADPNVMDIMQAVPGAHPEIPGRTGVGLIAHVVIFLLIYSFTFTCFYAVNVNSNRRVIGVGKNMLHHAASLQQHSFLVNF